MVESDRAFLGCMAMSRRTPSRVTTRLTIHFTEHFPHALDVVQVEEPCFGILVVFLKRDGKAGEGYASAKGPSIRAMRMECER